MPWAAFSISRPITSGISFWVSWANVQALASRWMISVIFFLMDRIWDELRCYFALDKLSEVRYHTIRTFCVLSLYGCVLSNFAFNYFSLTRVLPRLRNVTAMSEPRTASSTDTHQWSGCLT